MSRLPILLPILLLAGCGASTQVGQASLQINQVTSTDLKNAVAIAQNASPPDVEAVACFTWMDSQLVSIQAALTPANPATVSGVVSAFEVAHLGVNMVQGGMPGPLKMGFEQNCGAYVANVIGGINGLLMQVAGKAIKIP